MIRKYQGEKGKSGKNKKTHTPKKPHPMLHHPHKPPPTNPSNHSPKPQKNQTHPTKPPAPTLTPPPHTPQPPHSNKPKPNSQPLITKKKKKNWGRIWNTYPTGKERAKITMHSKP